MVLLKALGSDSLFAIGGGEDRAAAFGISYPVGPGWERLDGELAGA